ncbi:hypothetical protein BESB_046400 [Besnoitia besnoiti]|uniref:Plectin n=1 Tax=Besnoitia besnoiti TaxID=94643 RepID=A0A2A9MD76_BESBE|nr:hypothetical protein BESB_046400 [Besnoitia besnoiti]PFH36448.1 hypothetical protein BESB_046400 [Besnoitia besnoiti]
MAFSPEFLNRLSELGNEYQRLSDDHEKLKGVERQLQEQLKKLQREVGQLQEGRTSLLSENRSLIEKLQRLTHDHTILQDQVRNLQQNNSELSVQLADSRQETAEARAQLENERESHKASIGRLGETQEKLNAEIADLREKNKALHKKRQDTADQLRLMTEEQKRAAEQVQDLLVEKKQLSDRAKQLNEESRMLGMRIRTLTAKNKQVGEDKQQALQNLQLTHDEEKHKFEKRVRALESAREEAATVTKRVEEERGRLEQEYRRAEEDKRHLADQIASLETKLAEAVTERNKLQDALNNERNIVEENKERQRLEMDECVRRVAEEQNRLKENFAKDYRKACDEVERLQNEKRQVIDHILDFADMHGTASSSNSGPDLATPPRPPAELADCGVVVAATRRVSLRVLHLEKTVKHLTEQHRGVSDDKVRLEQEIAQLMQQNKVVADSKKLLAGQHARILQGIRELAEQASIAQTYLGSGDLGRARAATSSSFLAFSVYGKEAEPSGAVENGGALSSLALDAPSPVVGKRAFPHDDVSVFDLPTEPDSEALIH